LTWVAEIIVEKALEVAWWHLAEKHGSPAGTHQHAVNGFGVLAYGKLGGLELGYKSDLDLVFVHDHDIHQETLGPQPVNISTFFVRLAQRMVHILTAHTRFGLLYDIDLRLRPSGNKGPLVATLGAFERYQASSAWTWEHQALVRARFIAGDPRLGTRLDDIRVRVLSQKRNSGKLQKEVVGMREKMRLHLSPKSEGGPEKLEDGEEILVSGFDLKHGLGAIVDIEFMVQYAVLAWSWKYPELTIWTDKMRILDELNKLDLFISKEAMLLQKAYLAYRSAVHYQSLGGEVVHFEELEAMREKVADIWQAKMESGDAGMET
ncbi:MAG: bifunctional glutamine synthetase adenylyltransferase/deadenyltransferase, partial [Gammaproteobacteria bacterium]|nr:bifunctional glutamine synthetase adenylyltransferase/deadenyltransferase [Gammaproteobacteria bacterium]